MQEHPLSPAGKGLAGILQQRKDKGLFRQLSVNNGLIDFCSNDYLGLAHSKFLTDRIKKKLEQFPESDQGQEGSGGSRLLSGNTLLAETLEKQIAVFHKAEAALLFNSGYDANVGFFSCVPQRGETILYDELVHASIRDGIRLSHARAHHFPHNDLNALQQQLERTTGRVWVAVESVYSMDGDSAPLAEMAALCEKYNAALVVDEAHAGGIFGPSGAGLCEALHISEKVFARIFTYGKAFGCHGAAIAGPAVLRDFLINFSRPFIYTTALPVHSLLAIQAAYELMPKAEPQREALKKHILFFRTRLLSLTTQLLPSDSPIQCILKPGSDNVRTLAHTIRKRGYDVRAILSPTVAEGKERIRICLHAFNSETQLEDLTELLLLALI